MQCGGPGEVNQLADSSMVLYPFEYASLNQHLQYHYIMDRVGIARPSLVPTSFL
jgi:hypothetical protein